MNKVSRILSCVAEQRVTDTNTLEKFELLARHVAEENKKVNITSITDEVGIATKHFADSISVLRFEPLKKENIKMLK